MVALFRDREGVILVHAMPRGETTPTLTSGRWKKSGSVSNEFGLTRIQQKSCLQPESAKPHTSLKIRETITKSGQCTPHSSYNPDLAPSDFNLFRVPKDAFRGTKLQTDDMIRAVRTSLRV